jgi:coenzyme F420 biosynthesis associated uncharacterized protein
MAPIGPTISPADAAQAVADLRLFSGRAELVVRETTEVGHGLPVDDAEVLDRPGWIAATAEGMERLAAPAVAKLAAAAGGRMSGQLTRGVAGQQVGFILGFLSGKVLGQFDPLGGDPARPGRLLLVAPNIVHVERELDADPSDFRLWVCLHEETHRVQFTAVPWMRDHLFSEMTSLADTLEPTKLLEDGLKRAAQAIRGGGGSLFDMISTPEQRVVLDRITGVMSLLEGHADVVMDGVGPEVIPSVGDIRRKFTKRRKGVGTLDRVLRRLLGLDAKMAQYRDGAIFTRAAIDKVGMDGFNAVWAGPENLPSKAEIHDPDAWVARVHG